MSARTDPRTPRDRGLRREATFVERKLWAQLRLNEWPGGGHFRRQSPIGPYYADFAHHGLKLVVELDGGQHTTDEGIARDDKRTSYLQAAGYRVLRFWNAEVVENLDGVVQTIFARAAESPPTPVRASRDSALPAASGGRVGALVALGVLTTILWCSAPAKAQVERRAIGPWTLMSGKERDGVSYCTIELREGGRRAGLQVRSSGERFFGLTNPDWKWQARQQYAVVIEAGSVRWAGPAVAPLPETLGMKIGPTPDPIEAFEAADTLRITVDGATTMFSLSDFKPAAAAMRTCLAQAR